MTEDNADRCYKCGAVIPEGRQLCPNCEPNTQLELFYDEGEKVWKQAHKCEIYFATEKERDEFQIAIATGRLKVAPAPGRWIPDKYEYYHCSKCGYEHDTPELTTKFCPECGSPMEQGGNDGKEE